MTTLTKCRRHYLFVAPAMLSAFLEVRQVPPLKPFLFSLASDKKVSSRCGTHIPYSAAKGNYRTTEEKGR
ncbi:MAG: hypothetical protein WCQ55_02470 [Paludibacteraceae bacterium]|nr:hypothetical protein [Prevotellaceae bacterium]